MVNVVSREVPAAKTPRACGPSGFGLGTSLGTTFTMMPPRLFQIMSQYRLYLYYDKRRDIHNLFIYQARLV